MKSGIHPDYHRITVEMTDGTKYQTRSTWGMIMAIGAGEKRPYIVDDAIAIATVMSATGSFDHRAIDGADGAELMKVFKELVEKPLGLVA